MESEESRCCSHDDTIAAIAADATEHQCTIFKSLLGAPDGSDTLLNKCDLLVCSALLKNRWCPPPKSISDEDGWPSPVKIAALFQGCYEDGRTLVQHWNDDSVEIGAIEVVFRLEVHRVVRLEAACQARGAKHYTSDSHVALTAPCTYDDIHDVQEAIWRAYQLLLAVLGVSRIGILGRELQWGLEDALRSPTPGNAAGGGSTALRGDEMLRSWVLRELASRDYRYYHGKCYEQILSPPTGIPSGRHATRAWRELCGGGDVRAVILALCPKEHVAPLWQMAVKHSKLAALLEELGKRVPRELPPLRQLRKDRHCFAFHDGLYDTRDPSHFRYFGDECIPHDAVACRYFADPFPHDLLERFGASDLQAPRATDSDAFRKQMVRILSIPTPLMDSVITAQLMALPPEEHLEVLFCFYALVLGRNLFDVNELDTWNFLPLLVGCTATGKSVVAKTLAALYAREDVGIINNVGFQLKKGRVPGLSDIQNAFLCVCHSMTSDIDFDTDTLAGMVRGESVPVRQPYGPVRSSSWKAPCLFVGAEVPPRWCRTTALSKFSKGEGSFVESTAARLLVFAFDNVIDEDALNPLLEDGLKHELPALLVKAAASYRLATSVYTMASPLQQNSATEGRIKRHLPEYFFPC